MEVGNLYAMTAKIPRKLRCQSSFSSKAQGQCHSQSSQAVLGKTEAYLSVAWSTQSTTAKKQLSDCMHLNKLTVSGPLIYTQVFHKLVHAAGCHHCVESIICQLPSPLPAHSCVQ